MSPTTLGTWNVNGIRKRMPEVVEWIARDRPDFFALQEIKASPEQIEGALTAFPDYFSYFHGAAGGYSGVSLHVRKDRSATMPKFSHPSFDHETRIVQVDLGELRVASVYIPNGGKDYVAKIAFMKEMIAWVSSVHAEGKQLIVCGDMNVARADIDVHPSQRKPDIIGQRPEERGLFEAMIAPHLVDVGRAQHPDDERMFTWWPYWREARKRNLGWRLDYVFASTPLAETAKECRVLVDVGTSDHAPVVATFDF